MKRFIVFISVLITAVTIWAYDVQIGDLYYDLSGNTATVTYLDSGYYKGDIIIPASFVYNQQTYTVTGIDHYAFSGCGNLTSVSIPSTINSISLGAFWGCTSLSFINVDNSNTHFSSLDGVLYNYAKDTLIQYSIGNTRTTYTIPNTVTHIGNGAFSICSYLSSIQIPDSVTSIGFSAFSHCSSLTSVTITSNVISIGNSAFESCTSLKSITIPNSVTNVGDLAFYDCSSLTSLTIGNSVTSIGDLTFHGCTSLSSIIIGDNMTSISYWAFSGCNNITSVTWNAKNCNSKNFGSQVETFIFGDSVQVIPSSLCSGMSKLTSITIPNSVTNIGDEAFRGCSNLKSINIPSSIDTIGYNVFEGCTSLPVEGGIRYADTYLIKSVDSFKSTYTIKEGTKWIGDEAFGGCVRMTSITIPNSVTSIGNGAFVGCYSLTSITIPESIKYIGHNAFYECNSLDLIEWNAIHCNDFDDFGNDYYIYWPFWEAGQRAQSMTLIIGDNVEVVPWGLCMCLSFQKRYYYCKAQQPPVMHGDGMSHWNGTLYVPCHSAEAYRNAEGWTTQVDSIAELFMEYSVEVISSDTAKGTAVLESEISCDTHAATIRAIPNNNYNFSRWSDGNTDNPRQVTISQDTSFIAIFQPITSGKCGDSVTWVFDTISKTITLDGVGDIYYYDTIGGFYDRYYGMRAPWAHLYNIIETIIIKSKTKVIGEGTFYNCLSATSVFDYRLDIGFYWVRVPFVDYSSDYHISCFANINDFTYSGETFNRDIFVPSVIILETDTNMGRVEILEHETECGGNALIAAYVKDSIKYRFNQWSDGNKNAIRELEVTANPWNDTLEMSAYFELNNYLVAFNATEGGQVDKDSTYVMYLDTITFTAVPQYGYHFVQWSDGITTPTRSEIVRQDTSYYAIFAKNVYRVSVQWNSKYGNVSGDTCGLYEYQTNFKTVITPKYAYWAYDGKSYSPFEFTQYTTIASDTTIIVDFQPMQGWYGDSVQWALGTDSVLRFTGSGDMYNMKNTNIGWGAITKTIKKGIVSEGITNVGFYAFGGCTTMTSVELPSSVTLIARSAFSCCESLKEIAIPGNVTSIESDAFYDCQSLTSVTIPNEVQSIGSYAFAGCGNLTSIVFGSKLTSIGTYAFKDCYYVDNMTIFAETPPTVESTTFASLSKYTYLNVPSASLRKYQLALYWRDFLVQAIDCEATQRTISSVICEGDSIQFGVKNNGEPLWIKEEGIYHDTLVNPINGCDSIVTMQVNKSYRYEFDTIIYIVDGEVVNFEGRYYSKQGRYCFTYQNIHGCDSVICLNLFVINKVTISTAVNNTKYGYVEGGGQYVTDTTITLTAFPNIGYQFNQWSDGNIDNPRYVQVKRDATYTADFGIKQCSWLVESSDLEMGAVNTTFTNEFYNYGTQITVTASSNSGYKFVKWNDGKKYNPYTFTILDDKYLLAIFMAEEDEQDTTTVQPTDTTATFQWPFIEGGYTYTLTIYSDATCTKVICKLTFNQYGQLIGIAFGVPKRGGLNSQEENFTFTVQGLIPENSYFYKMETTDVNGKLLNTDEGTFTTQKNSGPTTNLDNQLTDSPTDHVTKILKDGQLYIHRDGKIYNAQGTEVR